MQENKPMKRIFTPPHRNFLIRFFNFSKQKGLSKIYPDGYQACEILYDFFHFCTKQEIGTICAFSTIDEKFEQAYNKKHKIDDTDEITVKGIEVLLKPVKVIQKFHDGLIESVFEPGRKGVIRPPLHDVQKQLTEQGFLIADGAPTNICHSFDFVVNRPLEAITSDDNYLTNIHDAMLSLFELRMAIYLTADHFLRIEGSAIDIWLLYDDIRCLQVQREEFPLWGGIEKTYGQEDFYEPGPRPAEMISYYKKDKMPKGSTEVDCFKIIPPKRNGADITAYREFLLREE
jgi:hypothetical protein